MQFKAYNFILNHNNKLGSVALPNLQYLYIEVWSPLRPELGT